MSMAKVTKLTESLDMNFLVSSILSSFLPTQYVVLHTLIEFLPYFITHQVTLQHVRFRANIIHPFILGVKGVGLVN